jgi:tetratricopeptide (TPR) repeat protein
MDRVSHHSWIRLCGVLGLIFLLLASLAHTEERPESMDLNSLKARAAELQQRLDQNLSDYEALRSLGIVYYAAALKDSKAYAKKAIHYLEEANQKKPEDAEVLCCLGTTYTLLAKDASDLASITSNTNKGIGFMDKAVRMDPDNISVRMIRANNSRYLPKFLNRRSVAYEDFEHLVSLFEKKSDVSPALKASVYRDLAGLYKEDGDAAKAQKYEAMAANIKKEK